MITEKEIVTVLQRMSGAKLSAEQITSVLGYEPREQRGPSREMMEVIRLLAKLVEYQRVQMAVPTPACPECVYWIEPKREAA